MSGIIRSYLNQKMFQVYRMWPTLAGFISCIFVLGFPSCTFLVGFNYSPFLQCRTGSNINLEDSYYFYCR